MCCMTCTTISTVPVTLPCSLLSTSTALGTLSNSISTWEETRSSTKESIWIWTAHSLDWLKKKTTPSLENQCAHCIFIMILKAVIKWRSLIKVKAAFRTLKITNRSRLRKSMIPGKRRMKISQTSYISKEVGSNSSTEP